MIIQANALQIPLADQSVHMVVTSPPYWGLRNYGVDGQLGLERTPEEYVANMVAVYREVWRVMRDDGTLWLNLGDSYAGMKIGNTNGTGAGGISTGKVQQKNGVLDQEFSKELPPGLKSKDLVGIPWRVAFALQADGWYLRSDIIWHKPNPMPESVSDRPTKAHEYVFLLTKQPRYFYDAEAIKEPLSPATLPRMNRGVSDKHKNILGAPGQTPHSINKPREHGEGYSNIDPQARNRRTVWTIATQPYSGAHFATYPEALVMPCILAGTSERGCCPKCGKPWGRVVEKEARPANEERIKELMAKGVRSRQSANLYTEHNPNPAITTGWQPACTCDAGEPIPALVFDPFVGSGTTVEVARRLGRRGVGLDLSLDYLSKQAKNRIKERLF